ncbi:hypothetical protein [Candidatus Nitrosocosmicus arcticus]|uniref:Uncharacterized protein n=1 Tax=Candidatus Nitrosocosmicus arcticus TaxID=2035267 RepID=A0A557SXR8_9ARCH|nr:hypothetical protein [Candidatus Nitrosocosmicus arcticus]TVP41395.1 hypothetical protein NARC_30109 [Candidatus Nitrosocosmicus arcticus]
MRISNLENKNKHCETIDRRDNVHLVALQVSVTMTVDDAAATGIKTCPDNGPFYLMV